MVFLCLFSIVTLNATEKGRSWYSSLIEKPPFGASLPLKQAWSTNLEFRGYMIEGDQCLLSISGAQSDGRIESRWVKIGESFHGCTIRAFNLQDENVTLELSGFYFQLKLKVARLLNSSVAPQKSFPEDKAAVMALPPEAKLRREFWQVSPND